MARPIWTGSVAFGLTDEKLEAAGPGRKAS